MQRKQNITNLNVSLILTNNDNFLEKGMLIILATSVYYSQNNIRGFTIYATLIQLFDDLSFKQTFGNDSLFPKQQGTSTPHFTEFCTHLFEVRSHFSLRHGRGPSPHGASHEVLQTSPGGEQPSFLGPSCHKLNKSTTFVIHLQSLQ